MFVILVYDFDESRVMKANKVCKRYLTWVQRSVFEGEISDALFRMLVDELDKIMDKNKDSVVIYKFSNRNYYERQTMGVKRNSSDDFIL
ncbi:MAG: CRISPR-associated endonuclease Cas2 [Brevinematales bacterium]|nr:CRISPR-associated endonuclease Cas2 [Brevinematales bacterium]